MRAAPCAEVSQRAQNHRLLHRKHDELGWMDLLASGGAETESTTAKHTFGHATRTCRIRKAQKNHWDVILEFHLRLHLRHVYKLLSASTTAVEMYIMVFI